MNEQLEQQSVVGIVGYTPLSPQQVGGINYVKNVGNEIGRLLEEVAAFPGVDMRWLAVARTHLQEGVMFVTRAIARPEGF